MVRSVPVLPKAVMSEPGSSLLQSPVLASTKLYLSLACPTVPLNTILLVAPSVCPEGVRAVIKVWRLPSSSITLACGCKPYGWSHQSA